MVNGSPGRRQEGGSSAGTAPPAAGIGPAAGSNPEAGAGAATAVKAVAAELAAITTRPWNLMEVCGGQTHTIVRWGLDQLLPEGLRLIHGPGCPVCVTPAGTIEQALQLARRPQLILCSYGDMLRVPGEGRDTLLSVRAAGGDVRLLTSPQQALQLALRQPDHQVVFLAVGFETTAPATALLARQALALGASNLSLLAAHVRVSPAMEAILADPANRVQGFLAAGHVCSVLGTTELERLVQRWRVPVVVSGFEPLELMRGVLACVRQLEHGAARVENAYRTVVSREGNPAACRLLEEVFEPCDRPWRGLGVMAGGGLALRGPYRALDAVERFGLEDAGSEGVTTARATAVASTFGEASATAAASGKRHPSSPAELRPGGGQPPGCLPCGLAASEAGPARSEQSTAGPSDWRPRSGANGALSPPVGSDDRMDPVRRGGLAGDGERDIAPVGAGAAGDPGRTAPAAEQICIAGSILRGLATPVQCPAFGTTCTPEQPLGAPMVSSEGACAAYFLYRLRGGIRANEGD